jgi:uncharacterized membrane protein YcaP (DUF421 family)
MFFVSWYALLRVLVVGVCAYAALVALVRLTGKRTLSKFNAFDLIVTVALGSTLATVLLAKDVALAEGLVALGVLVGLQFAVAWLSVRSAAVRRLVKSEPRLLFYRGEFLRDAMRAERVTEGEVVASVRGQGLPSLERVEAVVLETDGTLTAVPTSDTAATSLRHVAGPHDGRADG